MNKRCTVCVIGAGVSGLGTAYYLLSQHPQQYNVTVIAEKFSPNTTSDIAFGLWEPYMVEDTPTHKIKKWSSDTKEYMKELAHSTDAVEAGTSIISGYCVFEETEEDPPWKKEVVHFHHLNQKELAAFSNYKYGYYYTSAATECKFYLPYLSRKISSLGGTFKQKKLSSLTELYGKYDILVNCSGLGSRQLVNDMKSKPIRGQAIRVKAPWIKHFVMGRDDCYIIPGIDSVILGGTHDVDDWDCSVSQVTKDRIFKDCCELIPSLKHAEVLYDKVGLRPGRTEVRLEPEEVIYNTNKQQLKQKIVHNYGHGGAGITLHWGCAKEVAQLINEVFNPKVVVASKY